MFVKVGLESYATHDGATEEVRSALIAKFGMPAANPFDEFAPKDRRGSYGPAIADARFDKAMRIHYGQDNTISIVLIGLSWVGAVLLLSWLIRGFMA